jgi:hypothetical protein
MARAQSSARHKASAGPTATRWVGGATALLRSITTSAPFWWTPLWDKRRYSRCVQTSKPLLERAQQREESTTTRCSAVTDQATMRVMRTWTLALAGWTCRTTHLWAVGWLVHVGTWPLSTRAHERQRKRPPQRQCHAVSSTTSTTMATISEAAAALPPRQSASSGACP